MDKGIYESLRTYNGQFALMPEHEERLAKSCESAGLEVPNLREIVANHVREDVKLKVYVNKNGVRVEETPLPPWSGSFLWHEVWKVKIFHGARENAGVKHSGTEMQTSAREDAIAEGYGEVLLVNEDGFVREGGITNVFFVDGEKIITPGEGMLPGIARALVLRACKELGIEVELRNVREEELEGFDAIFLTSSIRGMVATAKGNILPIMQRVVDWCTEFIIKRI